MGSNIILHTYRRAFLGNNSNFLKCQFSTSTAVFKHYVCKILIIGGGAGGCSMAAKLQSHVNNRKEIIILEPNEYHYYQPIFTLIGGGICKMDSSARRTTKKVLPNNVKWKQDFAREIHPSLNTVFTDTGHEIDYDYLLIATGLQTNYDKIPGLVEALTNDDAVCSNYSEKYVSRTYKAMQKFEEGNAIFTLPEGPVKCPGAPQKICYLTEHYLRKVGKRDKAKIIYNTSLPVIFGAKRYADALWKVCKDRDINVNLRTNLIEVNSSKRQAVFQNLDDPEKKTTLEYSLLHVTPPMSTPRVLQICKELCNPAGFVEVNKCTMQSTRFENVFAIGDCSSAPNSKTAAAVAAQCGVVYKNMLAVMKGEPLPKTYDGYASCPLITGYDSCILAEFDYDLNPLETFPFRQDVERYSMYTMKKTLMPKLYWMLMLNGYWNGPKMLRKMLHMNFS